MLVCTFSMSLLSLMITYPLALLQVHLVLMCVLVICPVLHPMITPLVNLILLCQFSIEASIFSMLSLSVLQIQLILMLFLSITSLSVLIILDLLFLLTLLLQFKLLLSPRVQVLLSRTTFGSQSFITASSTLIIICIDGLTKTMCR